MAPLPRIALVTGVLDAVRLMVARSAVAKTGYPSSRVHVFPKDGGWIMHITTSGIATAVVNKLIKRFEVGGVSLDTWPTKV